MNSVATLLDPIVEPNGWAWRRGAAAGQARIASGCWPAVVPVLWVSTLAPTFSEGMPIDPHPSFSLTTVHIRLDEC